MPTVNRESLTQTHAPELDNALHNEVPGGAVVKARTETEVEAFNPANAAALAQQGPSVGSIAAGAVAQLDSNAVVGQVKQLMGRGVFDWRVSSDECAHALGLLESLPPREYTRALKELSQSGDLRTLCESMPPSMRRDLAESAVRGGATTMTPSLAAAPRTPQPPSQPELIANPPSLPPELREVIHAENTARGRQYEAAFHSYVDAWCSQVGGCKTPLELRELGPLSHPPRLLEPGIGGEDFKVRRFTSDLCSTHMGVERAAKAVSDQVSVFRGELGAGDFSVDVELRGQLTFAGEVASKTEGAAGGMFIAKASVTQDGRVINQEAEKQAVVAAKSGHNGVEGRFNAEGQVEAVSAEVGGAGLELERDGRATLKAPIAHGLAAETFVNHTNATSGADLLSEAEGKLYGADLKLEARIGFTAKGVDRAYYRDIAGAQEGFFGPMPELTEGKKWRELPAERREWYGRQGFDEQSWPR